MLRARGLRGWRNLMCSACAAALLTGCVTTSEREKEVTVAPGVLHSYLEDKPAELHPHFTVSLSQGQRNRVLNDMRLGLAAFEMGQHKLAEQLLDDALQGIEAVYANNDTAEAARGLFVKELVKDFKGEPYERVMAYYYRGLLYMRAGDYENARASFKGGMLQDAFAEEDQFRADFALMAYLQGWAAHCSGNASKAEEDFKEFKALNPDSPLPGSRDNLLVLVETGNAPIKYSATDPNSTKPRYLKYRRANEEVTAQISYNEWTMAEAPKAEEAKPKNAKGKAAPPPQPVATLKTLKAELLEDIYRQASTRGGREFDSILLGKAQFKDMAGTVGSTAMTGALVAGTYAAGSGDRNAAIAAGILLLTAAIATAVEEASQPDADTRYWDNLPDRVHGITLPLFEENKNVTVAFFDPSGTPLRSLEVPIQLAGTCGLAWVRSMPAQAIAPRAPFSAPGEQMARSVFIPPPQSMAESSPPSDVSGNMTASMAGMEGMSGMTGMGSTTGNLGDLFSQFTSLKALLTEIPAPEKQ
jgi:hypothetical protein